MDSSQRPTPQTSLRKSADLSSVAGCSDQDASGRGLRLPACPAPDTSRLDTQASSTFAALDSTRQHSDSSGVPCTPVATPNFSTGSMRSGLGRCRLPGDHQADTTTSLLRARSDAAILKDLKLSSVIGEGSYGRVWRGKVADTTLKESCGSRRQLLSRHLHAGLSSCVLIDTHHTGFSLLLSCRSLEGHPGSSEDNRAQQRP